jgi:hypothetical protein
MKSQHIENLRERVRHIQSYKLNPTHLFKRALLELLLIQMFKLIMHLGPIVLY